MTLSPWKMALKQFIVSVTSVLLVNFADPVSVAITSWPWWRHVITALVILTIVNECRYWRDWADKLDG